MTTEGLVCSRCGELHVYWDTELLNNPEQWVLQLKESAPMACKLCGVGEYKIVSDINPNTWCDDCGLPRKKCSCRKNFGEF